MAYFCNSGYVDKGHVTVKRFIGRTLHWWLAAGMRVCVTWIMQRLPEWGGRMCFKLKSISVYVITCSTHKTTLLHEWLSVQSCVERSLCILAKYVLSKYRPFRQQTIVISDHLDHTTLLRMVWIRLILRFSIV